MNELIKTTQNENGEILVSGRELHEFLEVGTQYTKWFDRMIGYGFTENIDFLAISQKRLTAQGNTTTYTDHAMNLDMAKEISMIQRTEKGKQARQYFILVEKMWNTPEMVIKRGYEALQLKVKEQQLLIGEQQAQLEISNAKIAEYEPKADYVDKILKCQGTMTTTQVAFDYGMSARHFNKLLHELGIQYKVNGQWILYTKHQRKGYVKTKTFERDGKAFLSTHWTQKGRLFLYEELKKAGHYPNEHLEVDPDE